ncbi:MAG: hypothetical protein KJ621_07125, partial [Proteobacteria bacterium]|nr:hypothetical protein [Pseudomonadota bacterium]MBU1743168.1 hypothetical protein [Pseudomonadota bacterium]
GRSHRRRRRKNPTGPDPGDTRIILLNWLIIYIIKRPASGNYFATLSQQQDRPEDGENELQWAKRKGWENLPDQCPEVPREDFMFILSRLAKSGLIVRQTMAAWDNDAQTYTVTETMRKLMAFLDQVDQA